MVKRWDRLTHMQQLKLGMKAHNDPVFFMESPYFNGEKLFPRQKEAVRNIYNLRKNNKIYEIIFAWGRRSGKTFMGSNFLSYGLYELLELPNPQKRFGLAKNSPIELDAVAKSGKQSKRTAFKQLLARLRTNPYFVHLEDIGEMTILTEEVRFPKEIYAYSLNSNAGSSVGGTVWMLIFEELVKFDEGETTKSASENYESLTAATATLAEYGAMSLVLSSIMHEEDIVMQLARKAQTVKVMYSEIAPTWEINPLLPFEGDWIQNKLKNTKDTSKFWREFGCVPEKGGRMYITSKDIWRQDGLTWNNTDINWLQYYTEFLDEFPKRENEFGEEVDVITYRSAQWVSEKMGLKPPKSISILPHVVAGDPAYNGDSFGLGLATLVEFPYFTNQTGVEKVLYVDGVYSFMPDRKLAELAGKKKIHRKQVINEGTIHASDIHKLLLLARANFNVCFATFDTWNYPSIQQDLISAGIIVLRNTVKRFHYDALKDRAYSGQLRMVNFNDNFVLEKELFKLYKKGDKLEHPKGFGKDGIDALVNCNWTLATMIEGEGAKPSQPSVVAVI